MKGIKAQTATKLSAQGLTVGGATPAPATLPAAVPPRNPERARATAEVGARIRVWRLKRGYRMNRLDTFELPEIEVGYTCITNLTFFY